MNKCKGFSKIWFLGLLLVAFVAGCANNGDETAQIDGGTGGGGASGAPTVTYTSPGTDDTGVPIDSSIIATFSEQMDPATLVSPATNFTLTLFGSTVPIAGTVTYSVNTATFKPTIALLPNQKYTATITTGATDLAGNQLVAGRVPNPWAFTTAPASVPALPLAINLGSAESFGIASREGLTSSGVTVVNGDVALYADPACTDSTGGPGGASAVCTGFKNWATATGMTVNGSILYAGGPDDLLALQVTNDLNTAWIQGKNKVDTFPAGFLSGQLGGTGPVGKTIMPGIYTENALNLATGYVATFDGNNEPNPFFIIRVTTSLTDSGIIATPTQIKLTRGANARNIWFIVGSDVTIGSGTVWYGNILTGNSLSISGGSTVTGRLLSGAAGAGAFSMTTLSLPTEPPVTINVPL